MMASPGRAPAYGGNRVLSLKERKVVRLVASGMRNIDVAKALGTTDCMIKNYLREIYDKLGLFNRLELALWYVAREVEVEQGLRWSVWE